MEKQTVTDKGKLALATFNRMSVKGKAIVAVGGIAALMFLFSGSNESEADKKAQQAQVEKGELLPHEKELKALDDEMKKEQVKLAPDASTYTITKPEVDYEKEAVELVKAYVVSLSVKNTSNGNARGDLVFREDKAAFVPMDFWQSSFVIENRDGSEKGYLLDADKAKQRMGFDKSTQYLTGGDQDAY